MCILISVSCQKNNSTNQSVQSELPDVTKPIVSVTVPIKFSTQNSDAPVHIVGTVTDNKLSTLKVNVLNLIDSTIVFEAKPNVQGKKGYTFNESFVANTGNTTVPCVLIIWAKDDSNNETISQTNFVLN